MDQAQQLRNVIKKQNQKIIKNARVITVTSGKGGVGKSNVAVNLAIQFQKLGKRVIIFDADFGLANVEIMFGAVPKFNLSDLIYHDMGIREIITEGPMGIGFISGGSGILGLNNLSKEQITYLVRCLNELNELADIIIVDTGAGIADSVLEFVIASPEVLLVTTQDPSSITDSYSLLKLLYSSPNFVPKDNITYVIANKVMNSNDGQILFEKINTVVEQFLDGQIDYLGMIPQDTLLEKSIRQQKPVSICYPNARSTKAFERLAEELLKDEIESRHTKWGITHLFDKLINR